MQPHEITEPIGRTGFGTGEDAGTMCTFFSNPVHMKFKSDEEGRPIYENQDFIRIQTPGQKNSIVERRVRDDDKHRFADVWKAYQAQEELQQDYHPIEDLPRITKSRALELKALRIPSIEALAQVPDGHLKNLGPDAFSLKKQAIAWLEETNGAEAKVKEQEKELTAQAVQLEKQAEQIGTLTKLVKDLTAKVDAKPKRGRPRSNDADNDLSEGAQ